MPIDDCGVVVLLFCRFSIDGRMYNGVVHDSVVEVIRGSALLGWEGMKTTYHISKVKLLPPVVPSKIFCVGRNYKAHAEELGNDVPEYPLIFMKPPSSMIGFDEEISLPSWAGRIDYEGELGVVIGKTCKNVSADLARNYIAGFTCFNDVTARDLQNRDGQWTRCKGFDTFAPIGPYMIADQTYEGRDLITRVNGRVVQSASTDDMIFPVNEIISFISKFATLHPGDIIATGTPSGIGPLSDGDSVEVEVSGIGVLKNHCKLR